MASSSDIRAGGAMVEISANDAGLRAGLQSAQARLDAFAKSLQTLGAAIGFGAIAGKIKGWVQDWADSGREMLMLSMRTGATVESLDALKKAAGAAGVEFGEITAGLSRMQRYLGALAQSGQQSNETLDQLGLRLADLRDLSPTAQLTLIGERISGLGNAAQRTAAAMEIFGRGGVDLLPAFAGLREGQEAAMGGAMSADDARRAFELSQAFGALQRSISGVGKTIGGVLAPAFTPVLKTMAEAIKGVVSWIKQNEDLVRKIGAIVGIGASAAAAIAGLATGIGLAKMAIGGLFAPFGALFGVLKAAIGLLSFGIGPALASPFGLVLVSIAAVVAAIGGIVLAFTTSSGSMKEAWNGVVGFMSQLWGRLAGTLSDTWKGVVDAFMAGDLNLAWQVVCAGMRVAWIELNNFLKERIGLNLIDIWASVRRGWANAVAFMRTVWIQAVNAITSAGERMGTAIGNWMARRSGASEDVITTAIAQNNGALRVSDANRQIDLNNNLAEIEADRTAAINRANADQAAGPGDLDSARIELDNALEAASIARSQAEARRAAQLPTGEGDPLDVAARGGAVGTFSASSAAGLFGGGSNPVVNAVGRVAEIGQQQVAVLREIADGQPRFV